MKQLYDIWFAHIMGVNCSNGGRIAQSGFGPRFYYNCRDSLKQFNIFTERQIEAAATTSLEDVEDIYRIHTENSIKSGSWYYLETIYGMDHGDYCGTTDDYPEGYEKFWLGLAEMATSR